MDACGLAIWRSVVTSTIPLMPRIVVSIVCAALYSCGRSPPVIVYWYCPLDERPPMLMVGELTTYVAIPGTTRSADASTGTSSSADCFRSLRGFRRNVRRPVFTVPDEPPYPLAR